MMRYLWCFLIWLAFAGSALAQTAANPAAAYFPDQFEWQRRTPAQVGMDAAVLDEAVRFVKTKDNPAPRDQAMAWAQSFGIREPYFGGLIGPTKVRAPINGLIVRHGYVVAEWGETQNVETIC